MRKEIIGLIVGVGLVYAQAVVAKDKDMNRNDLGKTSKVASNYDSKPVVKKNYYKHEKKNTQRDTNPEDSYSGDDRAYIGPKPTATSTRANQNYINNVESDLEQMRDHR